MTKLAPAIAASLLWLTAVPLAALELGLPLACMPGTDCWLVRLVDHDPGPGFADHRCGTLGSDGHDGTDFAIADPQRMAAGVPVLAAAAGVVQGVRDGMPDQPPQGRLVHDFADRNCGNGVLLRHVDGWETQYCHLRQGSVRVAAGDRVEAGQPLGLVGMSGEANFPHVHLSVRREGVGIDPFTGAPAPTAAASRARRSGPHRCGTGWPMSRCRLRSSGSPTTSPIATRSSPARPALPTSPAPRRHWSATPSPTACARATGSRSPSTGRMARR